MDPIVVATDLSARSDRAVARAARIAREWARPLTLFCAAGEGLDAAADLDRMEEVEAVLERRCRQDEALRGIETRVSVEPGAPAEAVPRAAAGAALVVLGTHRNRGLAELAGAPTLVRIVRALDGPALVAAGPADAAWGRAVVGWDHSPASHAALALAGEMAPDARLTLVHATHEPYSQLGFGVAVMTMPLAQREEMLREMDAAVPAALRARTEAPDVRMGGPCAAILGAAEDVGAQLIAVGRHARRGVARLILGETSADLMLEARVDVLVAPPAR